MKKRKFLIVVEGPTASGKTALAVRLAKEFNTVILSADSRQFFREMKIGTARPAEEELEGVPHYFLGSHSIMEEYNIGKFEEEALHLLNELFKDRDQVLLVGGSGLYIKMICEGLDEMPETDPEVRQELNEIFTTQGLSILTEELKKADPAYYAEVDISNSQRVIRALEVFRSTGVPFSSFRKGEKKKRDFDSIKIGIHWDREELYKRIDQRVDSMIAEGLFQEARQLYPMRNLNALQTVGYKEIFDYMDGTYDREEAITLIKRNTRRFAKRQLTWFRRDEEISWFGAKEEGRIVSFIKERMKLEDRSSSSSF